MESIFISDSSPETSEVHEMPLSAIVRPISSVLDDCKVEAFMKNMQNGDDFTPIEVLWVVHGGSNYYFSFGGCHRWTACYRLGLKTIKARLIRTPASSISIYLGASSPFKDK